jgi:putative PIN family toxin of toxin-antitoxin system
MRVVLDTNVLVSGTFWTGDSFEILKRAELKEIELILSEELINEYNEVINRDEIIEKIEDKNLVINEVIQKVISEALVIEPSQNFNAVKEDPKDNIILECAFEGKADFIVTNDNHLLKLNEFQGIKIVTPEKFLELLK